MSVPAAGCLVLGFALGCAALTLACAPSTACPRDVPRLAAPVADGEISWCGSAARLQGRVDVHRRNGELARRAQFAAGQRHGEWIEWYPNGQMRVKGSFSHGVHDGTWKWWFSDGTTMLDSEYVLGKSVGLWTWNNPNGTTRATIDYRPAIDFDELNPASSAPRAL